MRRAHRDRGEALAGRVHEACSNRHQSFTAAAFGNHLGGASALLPELHGAHDGQRLGGKCFTAKLGEQRRYWVTGFVEGLIRFRNPLPEVRSEFAQVVENSGECCHDVPRSEMENRPPNELTLLKLENGGAAIATLSSRSCFFLGIENRITR